MGERRLNRHTLHRAGHYGRRVILGVYMASIGYLLADLAVGLPKGLVDALGWFQTATVMTAVIGNVVHSRRLCEACIAQMPLDGSELAQRWDRQLRTVHLCMDQPLGFVAGMLAVIVGLTLASAWITTTGSHLILCVLLAWFWWSLIRHERVQPWCKRCGWDDGGEWSEVSDPDPAVHR